MKQKFWMLTLFTLSLLITNCKKDNISCSDEETFCYYVNANLIDGTGPFINNFLETLNKSDSPEGQLEQLKKWLECKNCVSKAEIICNSCISTYPPQSEIRVYFVSNGQNIEFTMDILMAEKLKFLRYHN